MTYRAVACYNRATNTFVGYLATHDNYTTIVQAKGDAAPLKWGYDGSDLYLTKETSPYNRYLGDGGDDDVGDRADWGLWGGKYAAPVVYHGDGSVSLAGAPDRRLKFPSGQSNVYWSTDNYDDDIIVVALPHPRAWMKDLPPATLIGDINLPGTHDSAAIDPTVVTAYSCHYRSITQQLQAGVRLLDVRLLIDTVQGQHGTTYVFQTCHGDHGQGRRANVFQSFNSLMDECANFLIGQPTEFIAMSLKIDDQNGVPDADLPDVLDVLDALLQEAGIKPWMGDMPSLETMKGKIYLLDRIVPALIDPNRNPPLDPKIKAKVETHSYGVPLGIADNTPGQLMPADPRRNFEIYVQDKYEHLAVNFDGAVDAKYALFMAALADKPAGGLLINFASGTWGLMGVYIQGSVAYNIVQARTTTLGWSLYDYEESVASTDLGDLTVVEAVIASNFGYPS